MDAIDSAGDSLRIACPNFSQEEADALRRLVGLLKPYLRRGCVVDAQAPADLCFVNLDADEGDRPHGRFAHRTVGCAARPRLHPQGTIHRPLRVAEVLAVLGEAAAAVRRGAQDRAEAAGIEWDFRLHTWPLEFEQWKRSWWRVLACLRQEPASVARIAARTGLDGAEIQECIDVLLLSGAVDRLAARRPHAVPRASASAGRWRALAARVGTLLGFSR